MNNVIGRLRGLMRSLFSNGSVPLKKLLIDLNAGPSNDFVVGDRWKMTDVKKRPKEGLVELLFLRKTSNVSGFEDVGARNPWMISMLIWKSYQMLSCCMITTKPDASYFLMFVADG